MWAARFGLQAAAPQFADISFGASFSKCQFQSANEKTATTQNGVAVSPVNIAFEFLAFCQVGSRETHRTDVCRLPIQTGDQKIRIAIQFMQFP